MKCFQPHLVRGAEDVARIASNCEPLSSHNRLPESRPVDDDRSTTPCDQLRGSTPGIETIAEIAMNKQQRREPAGRLTRIFCIYDEYPPLS
jgi:hypothetical protein